MKTATLLSLALLILSPFCDAEYSRRIWRSKDGLPESRIQAFAQTKEGYLWIGTSGGLVRFDGARFVVFDRSNTPALRDDSILAIHASRDGSLWIGTEGGGLVHLSHGAFQTFGTAEGLTNLFVRALHEDSSGTLWVGSDRGLFRFERGVLVRLDNRNGLPIASARTFCEDREGRLWIGNNRSLMVFQNGALREFEPEFSDGVRSILETRDGTVWFATGSDLQHLKHGKLIRDRKISVAALAEDAEGNLWLGTVGEGIMRLPSGKTTSYGTSAILPDRTINAIFADREDNLWIGTQDGLTRFSKPVLTVITRDDVSTISQGRNGTVWIATVTGKIYKAAGDRAVEVPLPPEAALGHPRTLLEDRKGALWIGTESKGVHRLLSGQIKSFNLKNGLRNDGIRQIKEDADGNIWIATGSGLSRWDGREIKTFYLEDGLAYGSIRAIACDKNGDLLIGTDGGLNRIHNGKFVADPVFASIGPEKIWSIFQDTSGTLWVGTRGSGLLRIRDGKVSKFTMREGLLSNSVYQILDDNAGKLWMSTPAGIFSVPRGEFDANPSSIAGVPYGTEDGMESSQMNGGAQPAGIFSSAGELWFPSVKGAVRINPKQLRVSRTPAVLIESALINDRPSPLDAKIQIPPGRGKVEIDYTACDLVAPELVRFKYKLEPFDDGWSAPTNHRAAIYTNLPPGNYRFRVMGADQSEASLAFDWQPQFHQTMWFYLLCALAAVLSGWAALRLYARQTRTRYALLLAERTRLAREMHDTVIQGCAGVSTLLEAASSIPNPSLKDVRELVDHARAQVRLTLDEARQAVWDLRHDSLDEGVASMLTNFARQFGSERGIPIETEIEEPPRRLDGETDRNLLLVAREAMRNAVTHGDPGMIKVRLCFAGNEARLEVADDGCGFVIDPAPVSENGHYGILGMRERVEQLGGSFRLESEPGHGTKIIACVPLEGHLNHE